MRGCAAFLFLSLIAIPALPQCGYQLVYSGQFRTTAYDLALDGNNLWLATGYGVSLFDRSVDPPALVASIAVPGVTRVVRAANGIAYAGSGSSVSVITRSGRKLQIIRTIDFGSAVNDVLLNGLDIYAGTANGIVHFDGLTSTPVSSIPNVVSLALNGSTLYAAHGDSTIDVFDLSIPTLPQHTGTFSALPRTTSLHLAAGRLFASDGQQTQIFGGSALLASVAGGSSEVAALGGNVVFMAGNDRRIIASDFSTASNPIELFRTELAPGGGSVNRMTALATTTTRLYAAAGDIGLLTYDISSFAPPFPQRTYGISGTTSIAATPTAIYVGRTATGIVEYLQSSVGSLTQARGWDNHVDVTLDTANGFLLTSSGATVTEWALNTASAVTSATLRTKVVTGVLVGQTGYVLLADNTLWSVDFTQLVPAPQLVSTGTLQPTSLARSGSSLAVAAANADATTSIGFFSDPSKAIQIVTIPGVATTPVTLSGTTAAVYTFSGVNLVDFATGKTTTLNPAAGVARQLLLSGTTLFEATDDTFSVIDTTSRAVTRQFALAASPLGIVLPQDSSIVDVVTANGISTIAYKASVKAPALVPSSFANAYYKKVVGTSDHLYLSDGHTIDIFTSALQWVASVRPPGLVDFAVVDGSVVALQGNGFVAAYTYNGVQIGGIQLTAAGDAQWQWINAVNGAVWVSLTQGCTAGACVEQTLVLDPHTGLQQSSSFLGSVRTVTTNGTRAFAIIDIPSEIRVFDVHDAAHPATVATAAAEGTRAPVAIADAGGIVYVLGEKLYEYGDASLAKMGELLDPYAGDANGTTYPDQRIAVDGACGFLTGRTPGPQFLAVPQWTPLATLAVPAAVRSVSSIPGRLFLLTDNSLEIWSTTPLPKPARRHPSG